MNMLMHSIVHKATVNDFGVFIRGNGAFYWGRAWYWDIDGYAADRNPIVNCAKWGNHIYRRKGRGEYTDSFRR